MLPFTGAERGWHAAIRQVSSGRSGRSLWFCTGRIAWVPRAIYGYVQTSALPGRITYGNMITLGNHCPPKSHLQLAVHDDST